MIKFKQSRNIYDYSNILNGLLADFGAPFCQTVLQWCKIIDYNPSNYWEVYIVEKDDSTIGICGLYSLDESTEELWLGLFGILPELRNQKIGKDVMKFLYAEAEKLGCKRIMSYVDQGGKPLSFYKREGFDVIGTVDKYLKDNSMRQIDGEEFESLEDFVILKKLN